MAHASENRRLGWHVACFIDGMKAIRPIAAALIACYCVRSAYGFEAANLERIRATAEGAVRAALPNSRATATLAADALDPRLKLAACGGELQGKIAGDGTLRPRTLVAVSCDGPVHWNIYISVAISSEPTVLRARRALARGEALVAEDFEAATVKVAGLSADYIGDVSQLDNRVLRRPLAPGEALAVEALSPRKLIRRGEQLTLLARAGSFEVRATGIALADGEQNQRIRVQNSTTQRVVEGIVRSVNLVEVPL